MAVEPERRSDIMMMFWGPSLYRLLLRSDERSWTWRIATVVFWIATIVICCVGLGILLYLASILQEAI